MSEELIEQLCMLEHFRDLDRGELERIANVAARLRKAPLFSSLSFPELAFIAEKGRVKRFDRGAFVIREGDTDKVFYVIAKGQVRVWARQAEGARLLNYHGAGDFFGELTFWDGAPRSANVDVVEDVELVAFEREGFERIVQHDPIRNYLRIWGRERIRRSNQPFPGKHWDEITIVKAHKSWFALARMILFPVFVLLLGLALGTALFFLSDISPRVLLSTFIALAVVMGLWILWMWEDWRNDDFVVSSKRIIHIERFLVPPFPVERHEAFVEQVQDITTRNHGLWTWLFSVQTLQIKTAGAGVIEFPYLADADNIREQIFRARNLARIRRDVEDRGRIRQVLFEELNQPVEPFVPLESGETVEITPERRGLLRVIDYFIPRMRVVQPDRIVWRKHWLVLFRGTLPAIGLLGLSLALLALMVLRPGVLGRLVGIWAGLIPVVLLAISVGWYLWSYDGWRNDVYIVTDTRIIDIEGSSFHLREETRTEGTFDVIQNTDYNSPNWLARVFRIGDVTIDTASQQKAFTFDSVARPDEVQQEIFKRLIAYRERRAREENERQAAELAKWFDTYHRSVFEQEEEPNE
jgi:membrane protein YdbS with pleckstrin-like domain